MGKYVFQTLWDSLSRERKLVEDVQSIGSPQRPDRFGNKKTGALMTLARWRIFLPLVLAGGFASGALALGIPQSSVSRSKQFIVYCDDAHARMAVTSFAEEIKSGVLGLVGQSDEWKLPIVIKIEPASSANLGEEPSRVGLYEVEGGSKVEIDVRLGEDAGEAEFPRQLIRAILLEFAYRNEPAVKAGTRFAEPPRWLAEAIAQQLQNRRDGTDAGIFKTLIDINRLPSLRDFLSENAGRLDSTSLALYRAYAVSLLQLILDQPGGRDSVAAYVRDLPRNGGDAVGDFCAHFASIASSEKSLEKWWTVSLARLSAADRYKGMSFEGSRQALCAALTLKVPLKSGEGSSTFSLEQFREFLKLPQSREPLRQMDADLLRLSTQSNPLLRPVVLEYQQIVRLLSRGKTNGIGPRLVAVSKYNDELANRTNEIGDYLNWFEATKMATRSGSFDTYLKTANQLSGHETQREDSISRYMDRLEGEYR